MTQQTEQALESRRPFLTPWSWLLVCLAGIAIVLSAYRFLTGIGSVANLNDAYPWGFWIGFDVLAGVALAAGGFTLTAVVYVWQNDKYHCVVRPALLTAFLGYAFFVVALMVDLGRYYRIWHVLWPGFWHHDSVMFEVGWCVTLYLIVLLLECLPIVFERFQWSKAQAIWRKLTPAVVILLLCVFTLAMVGSLWWVVLVAGIMLAFELLRATKLVSQHDGPPMLLIIAGIVLSCLHQSSLGSLYLIAPHKLHPLWYSPMLPVMFLLSAIAVGPAMVIFESVLSGRVFKHELKTEVLTGLGRAIPIILGALLVLRVGDLVARDAIWYAFGLTTTAIMFWTEIVIGYLLPIAILGTSEVVATRAGAFTGALCVIVGVVVHRLNVAVVGMTAHSWRTYTPAVSEVLISVGIISLGLLVFRYAVLNAPVFEKDGEAPAAASS